MYKCGNDYALQAYSNQVQQPKNVQWIQISHLPPHTTGIALSQYQWPKFAVRDQKSLQSLRMSTRMRSCTPPPPAPSGPATAATVTWANVPPETPLASRPGFTATTASSAAAAPSITWLPPAAPAAAAARGSSLAKGARLEGSNSRSGEAGSCRAA